MLKSQNLSLCKRVSFVKLINGNERQKCVGGGGGDKSIHLLKALFNTHLNINFWWMLLSIITDVTYCSALILLHLLPIGLHLTAHHVYLNRARAANSAIQWAIPILSLTFNLLKLASLPGGKCNASDTIYTAECTEHKLIYVIKMFWDKNSEVHIAFGFQMTKGWKFHLLWSKVA